MNYIEKVRKEISDYFNPKLILPESNESVLSPSKNFRLDIVVYKQDKIDANWEVTKVEIYELKTSQIIFDFFINDSSFFYDWIDKDNLEYFICAEDIFGGQTIIDLTNRKMSSYSPNEDGFIWTEFFISPDQKTLAIKGCCWACSYEIKLYDFTHPLLLPLPEIKEIKLLDNAEIITCWLDNETIELSKVEYETVREGFDDDTHNYKITKNLIGEKRKININSTQ